MHMHASGQCGVAQREARLCRQKKVAAMAYYTQKLIRQAAAAISTRIDQTHALPDDQCKLLAAALMHICDMHAHLFPWPARQLRQAGRHTIHASESDDQATCMSCPNEIRPRSANTEGDRSSHGSPQRAGSISMHAFPKERDHNSREKAKAGLPSVPGKAQKPHACMASPGHGWSVLFNHTKRRQLRPPSSRPSAVQTDQTGARVYMYLASSDELLRSDPDYNHLLLAYCSLFYRRSYLVDQKGQRPLARREQFAAACFVVLVVCPK